jgi:hypothetical protein
MQCNGILSGMLKPPVATEACLMPRSELVMFNSCMVRTSSDVVVGSVDFSGVAEAKESDIHEKRIRLVATPA